MGTITRIGHPLGTSLEKEEKSLEPTAPTLFDTPSKSNYHTSTGFGKPQSLQSIAVKEVANSQSISFAVDSTLLHYSIRRRSLPLGVPGRKCRERIRHCQKSNVVSHIHLPHLRRSSRRNECKAYEESRTLYREATTRQRPARRLLHTLQFKSRKGTSRNLCVPSTRIDEANHGRSTAEEDTSYHPKRFSSKRRGN